MGISGTNNSVLRNDPVSTVLKNLNLIQANGTGVTGLLAISKPDEMSEDCVLRLKF